MPTRVLLVRHGATALTAEDRFSGSTDVELSDRGRRQIACLAERLKLVNLAAVYASPLHRSLESASLIAEPHGLTPIVDPAFREIDYGRWEGLKRSEIQSRFGDEFAIWQQDPFTIAPLGGESGISVLNRALPALRDIVERHPDRSVAIVSHKGTNRLIVGSLLGFDVRGYRDRLDQSPAALTILDFTDAVRPRLRLFNDVSHYEKMPDLVHDESLSHWWAPLP
jgi:broad specificity phosphatase PhoE